MPAHEFTLRLLEWFAANRRDLPWRQTSDPYQIWLSEVILQQTRIEQGWSYWERFVSRWPTVEALAAASEDEVLLLWQGLGYYSRARNLHQAARQVMEQGGQFPDTLEGIRRLKGVGDYTAAAIASIAFGLPHAVVDGNVYRLLSRYFSISTPINSTEGKHLFADLAQQLLPEDRASDFNQAMMDFGALQCTPRQPSCGDCPLQEGCGAFREGSVEQLPVKLQKLKVKERHLTYVFVRHQGQVAIHKRGAGDIWQGLWEPVLLEDADDINVAKWAGGLLPAYAYRLSLLRQGVRHVLTHRRLTADFYLLDATLRPELPQDFLWVSEADISNYALSRLVEMGWEMVKSQ